MANKKHRIPLDVIAKACGVSRSTVSRALRRDLRVKQATQEKIRDVADSLGYVANRNVSRLMSELRVPDKVYYHETLAYLTADLKSYEPLIYKGVLDRAAEMGYRIDRFEIGDGTPGASHVNEVLKARGIRGVILAPFGHADARIDLEWERLSAVAIGYTLAHPELNRVERSVVHHLRSLLLGLRRHGYGKIGFIMERSHEERMDYMTLAAYLVHEWQLGEEDRVPVFIRDRLRPAEILAWYQREKPQLVLTMNWSIPDWFREAGVRVPEDVGVLFFNTRSPDSRLSGVYPNYERMGGVAVQQLVAQLERGEFGLPAEPTVMLIPGIWCAGETIPHPLRLKTP